MFRSVTADANKSRFSLDILSQALHETFGDDIPLMTARISLPMLENAKESSDIQYIKVLYTVYKG